MIGAALARGDLTRTLARGPPVFDLAVSHTLIQCGQSNQPRKQAAMFPNRPGGQNGLQSGGSGRALMQRETKITHGHVPPGARR
jgi:hypothetical protein